MRFSKSSSKRKVHSNTSLPQETRETSNKQPKFNKATRKRRNEEPQSWQKERNHKNLSRNKWGKKTRRLLKKSTKLKAGSSRR